MDQFLSFLTQLDQNTGQKDLLWTTLDQNNGPRTLDQNEGRSMVAAGLGGLSIGLLVVGLLVNQYDQRFGLNSLRTLDFGLSKLISSNSRINRRVIRRNGYYQKPTTMDNFSGYGIVDAASEAFETVKKVTGKNIYSLNHINESKVLLPA